MLFVAAGVGPANVTIPVALTYLHWKQPLTGVAGERRWQSVTHEGQLSVERIASMQGKSESLHLHGREHSYIEFGEKKRHTNGRSRCTYVWRLCELKGKSDDGMYYRDSQREIRIPNRYVIHSTFLPTALILDSPSRLQPNSTFDCQLPKETDIHVRFGYAVPHINNHGPMATLANPTGSGGKVRYPCNALLRRKSLELSNLFLKLFGLPLTNTAKPSPPADHECRTLPFVGTTPAIVEAKVDELHHEQGEGEHPHRHHHRHYKYHGGHKHKKGKK